jgi:hypothetical protein
MRLLESSVLQMGLPKEALCIETPVGENHEIVATVVPHTDLPKVLTEVWSSAQSMFDEELNIDVFHAPFRSNDVLMRYIETITLNERFVLEEDFRLWCDEHAVPYEIDLPEPKVFN